MRTNPIPTLNKVDQVRFLGKIAPPNEAGCRLWTDGLEPNGYARFWFRGGCAYAHRLAYALFVGPIPDGTLIDHRCHVESCCAPGHLRLASTKQNAENLAGPRSSSGVRGVYFEERSGRVRWKAIVQHNGRQHNLGRFDTIAEAEAVVVAERLRLFTHNDLDHTGG